MKKGFTLIELLVVVLIIGILSAIALPQYTLAVEKARMAEALQNIGNLQRAIDIYIMENGFPPGSSDNLYFTGNNGKNILSIDFQSGLDCSKEGVCASKNFLYEALCDNADCYVTAFRQKENDVYNGQYENYRLFTSRRINSGWTNKECGANITFPYSEKLCKSLESQGYRFYWEYD